jgi:hypothetical protein
MGRKFKKPNKTQKNPIKPNKTQKNPPGWVFKKKTRVFANPEAKRIRIGSKFSDLAKKVRICFLCRYL